MGYKRKSIEEIVKDNLTVLRLERAERGEYVNKSYLIYQGYLAHVRIQLRSFE